MRSRPALVLVLLSLALCKVDFAQTAELEIHYINVGQGGSTLIIGPNGTTILYDFGNIAGKAVLLPYLNQIDWPRRGREIDYAIISHGDRDHFVGYADVVDEEDGFDIKKKNFEPGTKKRGALFKRYALDPAKKTKAGAFTPIPLGYAISLGRGAQALVVAANGQVWGEEEINHKRLRLNENDRSIALFVQYRDFTFLIDGDLGAGPEKCTKHVTNQLAMQPRVARTLLDHGLIDKDHGIDVLHIAHHGSESSTSAEYYNMMKPEVGLISVGPKQGSFRHPRKSVVENVLTCRTADGRFSPTACIGNETRPACVKAPALKGLFQTDNGSRKGCRLSDPHCISYMGTAAGHIVLRTSGTDNYTVAVDPSVTDAAYRVNVPTRGKTWTYPLGGAQVARAEGGAAATSAAPAPQ